jgi:large subunit ribosomal protein LP1
VKDLLSNVGSGGGAAPAAGGAAAAAGGAAAAEETKEEGECFFPGSCPWQDSVLGRECIANECFSPTTEKEESDDDMGFGLFD